MGKRYCYEPEDSSKAVKARGTNLRVHYKHCREIAAAVCNMNLQKAIKYLRDVVDHVRIIPFRVHTGGVGRHAQAKNLPGGKKSSGSKGRWPEKATRVFIDLLKNAVANGENRSLEVDKLVIQHIQVNHAPHMRRRTYRAHGRINAYMSCPAHIEIICVDEANAVRKAPEPEAAAPVPTRKQLAIRRVAERGD